MMGLKFGFILLILFGFFNLSGYAQSLSHGPTSEIETIIIETELDPHNESQIDEHEEDIKQFLSDKSSQDFKPSLLSIEKLPLEYLNDPTKINYKVMLKWPKPHPTFDLAQFHKNFQLSVKNYKHQNPTLYYYKPKNTGKLPGLKLSKVFSASIYSTPMSYISPATNFRSENQTYAGKNVFVDNHYWWEGSARLQLFMDLSEYLNIKNQTKILLTAGYYSSFMNIKQQDDVNGYLSNINSEGLRFHGPNYGEFNVGVRIYLDRKKNPERKPPKFF